MIIYLVQASSTFESTNISNVFKKTSMFIDIHVNVISINPFKKGGG